MSGLIPRKFMLRCNGSEWQGWKSLSVKQSLDSVAHGFSIEATDRALEKLGRWNVQGGSEVEILIDGDRVFRGYVQKYAVKIGASDHSISIEGSSRAIDLVECSHMGPWFWKNTTPEAIIAEVLKPFGFAATFDRAMKPIGKEGYKAEVGKLAFDIIKELAERDGMTAISDLDGNIRLYDGKNAADAGAIIRGDYVDISADHDLGQAFSEIVVKGQQNDRAKPAKAAFAKKQRGEHKVSNSLAVGSKTNPRPLRYRPIVYVQNGNDDAQKAFAEFVRSRFTGDVITASVTVKSHRNPKGNIWAAGQELFLQEELLSVAQKLVVADVEFKLDDSGYQTVLGLKIPASYDPLGSSTARDALIRGARRATGAFGNATRAIVT